MSELTPKQAMDFCETLDAKCFFDYRIYQKLNRGVTMTKHLGATEDQDRGYWPEHMIGFRVLGDGNWGISSTKLLTKKSIKKAFETAEKISKSRSGSVKIRPGDPVRDKVVFKARKKFNESKALDLLYDMMERPNRAYYPHLIGEVGQTKISKYIGNSEGTRIEQTNHISNVWLYAVCKSDAGNIGQHFLDYYGDGGMEALKKWNARKEIQEILLDLPMFLDGKKPKQGNKNVIVDPYLGALMVHEHGHKHEADRLYGKSNHYAGETYARKGMQIGSELINIVDVPEESAVRMAYDDEGTQCEKVTLVKDGVVNDFLNDMESAYKTYSEPNGCGRTTSPNLEMEVRMRNTKLLPGDMSLDEMIKETKNGYLMKLPKGFSMAHNRSHFEFTSVGGYEIKNGELGAPTKPITILGREYDFFNTIDALSKEIFYNSKVFCFPNCGKGDPGQAQFVGNGAPYMKGVVRVE